MLANFLPRTNECTPAHNMDAQTSHDEKANQVRVQFSNEINKFEDGSNIQVQVMNQFLVNVHLGFLQIRHRYEIQFRFECYDLLEGKFDLEATNSAHAKVSEIKVIKTMKGSKTKPALHVHKVTAQLFAHKEKLLREKLYLQSKDINSHSLTFVFYARVLGNGKGTPMLKDGIRCIGLEPDEDED